MAPPNRIDPSRHHPDTRWKLVDARCRQPSDAVAATRTPFLVALTWSFIWAWALYSQEYSYLQTYEARYSYYKYLAGGGGTEETKAPVGSEKDAAAAAEKRKVRADHFLEVCDERGVFKKRGRDPFTEKEYDLEKEEHRASCKAIVEKRYKDAATRVLASRFVEFPGGFTKLYITDLAVMGNVGLLLVLVWSFYSFRRENHAIKAFIEIKDSNQIGYVSSFLKTVELIPKDKFLSSEHYAYAYNAVSQRFVFILSSYSRPLLYTTIALASLPAMVSSWNFYTDMRDLFQGPFYEKAAYQMAIVETVLLCLVWYLTISLAKLIIETSVLLNAWSLGVRDVWMQQWDESAQVAAPGARVDLANQQAEVIEPDGEM